MILKLPSFIVVGDAPELLKPLEDLKVIAPAKAVFKCKIEKGKPKAKISWYKDNKEIYASNKCLMSYEDNEASLSIAPSELMDAGTYRCEAVNKLGRVETEAKLTVHCKYHQVISMIFLTTQIAMI